MFLTGFHFPFRLVRFISFILCLALVFSAMPSGSSRGNTSAQTSGSAGQSRKLPPYYKLPKINDLLTEGKQLNRPTLPQPPLKPSTTCGYRDKACQVKLAKEKKISQNFAPASDNTDHNLASTVQKNNGNWIGRLGRAFSRALFGNSASTTASSSFLAEDSSRIAGSSVNLNNTVNAANLLTPPAFMNAIEAKLDPRYRVGGAGEDLFSGNYNFSLPLVNLPGRAGLDLNLTLSYNSLPWVRYSNVMSFDYDYYPSLTPGFRLGFPEIDGLYVVRGVNTYIVYLPSGRRVEMRQVVANRFEAIDSSYLYLTRNSSDPTQMTLFATDGTQYKYELPPNGYPSRCTQIKDSNGNYISIIYKNIGDPEFPLTVIDKVIDTLGREIVFNYDGALHLISITQNWSGQIFTWAQFDYGTAYISPNFGSLVVDGPYNMNIPVITRVITGDGARTTFGYNPWGQVYSISKYGELEDPNNPDNYLRSRAAYAFPDTSSPLSDCPRFYQRNDIVFAWPGEVYNQQTQLGYATTYFYFEPTEAFGQVTGPDLVSHREYFSTTNGTRGLTTRTEAHYGGQIQQFTDLTWVSDSFSSPPLRPRIIDLKVCDDRNHNGVYDSGTDKLRRTTIDYTLTSIRLPEFVTEYNEGGQSVYRTTVMSYEFSSNYISTTRRIIGLPVLKQLYEGTSTLVAQAEYLYDSPNEAGTTFLQAHPATPCQHDSANYGTGFSYRGNLTKVRRYSVVSGSASSPIESKVGYYTTGTPALTKDGMDHQTTIFYDDSFRHYTESSGTLSETIVTPNPPTFAYPTKVTVSESPIDVSSTASFNYDYGAVTKTVNPKAYALGSQTMGISTYDSKGRLDKSLVWKDGTKYSQMRYIYGTDHNYVQTWTTVTNINVNDPNQDTAVLHLLDGIGRERMVVNEHPGSVGGLSAYYRVFDKNGRVSEWSRPTEISSATWAPTGDDTGYVYWQQAFDWKGRPTITKNPDHTEQYHSDRIVTYDGCGCAGADVTTIQSEPTTTGAPENRRTQKMWRDVQGRTIKTQILNYDSTPYSTTLTEYDIRDLVTTIKTFKGDAAVGAYCPLGTCQQTEMVYDGHGRLQKQYLPIYQDPGVAPPYSGNSSARSTTWQYDNDDRVSTGTDPRGGWLPILTITGIWSPISAIPGLAAYPPNRPPHSPTMNSVIA